MVGVIEWKKCEVLFTISARRMSLLVDIKYNHKNRSEYNLTANEALILPIVENRTYHMNEVIKRCTSQYSNSTINLSSTTYVQVYAWVALITALAGIIGNLAVISTYLFAKRKLDSYKLLIVHLAACDFIFAVVQFILAIPSLDEGQWIYGDVSCSIFSSLNSLGGLVAIGTILLIARERFTRVVHCFDNRNMNGKRRILLSLLCIWVASVVSVVPIVLVAAYDPVRDDCVERWENHGGKTGERTYSLYLFSVFFVLPMVLIAYYYGLIIKEMKNSFRQTSAITNPVVNAEYLVTRRKLDQRITKVLLIVTVLFCVCVSPIRVFRVVRSFLDVDHLRRHVYLTLIYVCLLPYPFHVAVNPIVYGALDRTFVRDLKNFVRCRRQPQLCASQTNIYELF